MDLVWVISAPWGLVALLAGMCARRRSHFLCLAKESNQRKATPLAVSPALRFGAACDARAWGGAAELALFASLSPLKQPQRVRARSAACCAARPAPRPALLGTARGALKPIRAIAALGVVLLPLPLGEGGGEGAVSPSPAGGRQGWGPAPLPMDRRFAPTPTLPQRGREQVTLTPALSRKREREPSPAARSSGADRSRAERSDGPCGFPLPSGCAEERSGRGERMQRSKHPHRDLTRRGCLNGAAQPRSEFRGAPRP